MKTNSLSPCWARIVHRLHTLGIVESCYANSICQLSEVGRYPQHIASANERNSQSVDGSVLWNFLNWHSGWVESKKIDSSRGTEFRFLSSNNISFHRLRLLEAHHDDCLNCILQIFARNSTPEGIIQLQQQKNYSVPVNTIAHICEQSLTRTNRSSGFKIDMLTEGGVISKSIIAKDLSIHQGTVSIHCEEDKTFEIFSQSIAYIRSRRVGREIHTALYSSDNLPQATLRLSA